MKVVLYKIRNNTSAFVREGSLPTIAQYHNSDPPQETFFHLVIHLPQLSLVLMKRFFHFSENKN